MSNTDMRPLAVKVEEAYANGAHDVEICGLLRLTQKDFQNHYLSDPKFREVVDMGRTLSQAFWLSEGRSNLQNPKFNNSLWAFNMKNRFGWADKTETINQDVSDDSLEALGSKLHKMLPQVFKKLYPGATSAEILAMTSIGGEAN